VPLSSHLPPFLIKTACAARSLRSTGITPLLRYCGPARHRLVFDRFLGPPVIRSTLLHRFRDGTSAKTTPLPIATGSGTFRFCETQAESGTGLAFIRHRLLFQALLYTIALGLWSCTRRGKARRYNRCSSEGDGTSRRVARNIWLSAGIRNK
jgi:hypothetical protein